jgi:hypothetical protein
MKAPLPIGTKLLINAAGRLALETADPSGEFEKAVEAVQDSAAETAEVGEEEARGSRGRKSFARRLQGCFGRVR